MNADFVHHVIFSPTATYVNANGDALSGYSGNTRREQRWEHSTTEMFEGIHIRRPIVMICLFYLHTSIPFHEVDNILIDQRTAITGAFLSQITWSTLRSDNMLLLKLALDHKHEAVSCSLSLKNLIFSPVKLEHLRKYKLILRSTWVKMKLVFHNATIAPPKYCLIDRDLLKIGGTYHEHTNFILAIQHLIEVVMRNDGSSKCFWKQQENLTSVL